MSKYEFIKIEDTPRYEPTFNELVTNEKTDPNDPTPVHTRNHNMPGLTENEKDILRNIVYTQGVTRKDCTISDNEEAINALNGRIETYVGRDGKEYSRVVPKFDDNGILVYFFYEPVFEEMDKEAFKQGKSMIHGRYKNGIIMVKHEMVSITNYLIASDKTKDPQVKHKLSTNAINSLIEIYKRKHGGNTDFVRREILDKRKSGENEIDTALIIKHPELEKILSAYPQYLQYLNGSKAKKDIYLPIPNTIPSAKAPQIVKDVFNKYGSFLFLMNDLLSNKELQGLSGTDPKFSKKIKEQVVQELIAFDKKMHLHPVFSHMLEDIAKKL